MNREAVKPARNPQRPPSTVQAPGGRGRPDLRWIGLGLWLALLVGIALTARLAGVRVPNLPYLTAVVLATTGVIGLMVYARLTSAPPQLRTLRILAVLLPSFFVVCLEAILFMVEADDLFTEVGEHVLATTVLSLGAVPFAIWIFRSFAALHDQLGYHAERLVTLHRASLAVTGEPTIPRLQEAIVRGARTVVPGDRAVLLVSPRAGRSEIAVADPPAEAPEDRELALLREAGIRGSVSGVEDTGNAYLAVRAPGPEPGGHALLVERAHGPAFIAEEALLLDMFAVAAAAGLENADRLEEAQRLAAIEERERIARDLHDDLGQLLGFLTTKIQAARELVATDRPALAAAELSELEGSTRVLSAQVREAILGLRTSVGADVPLGQALEEYTAEFGIQAGLQAAFAGSPEAGGSLPVATRYQLLRIAQEAMSNARRHAGAGSVTVSLSERDGALELRVHDDGIGFDADAPVGSGGFGLKTMLERARAVGGTLAVHSTPGQGTTVHATVPTGSAGGG